MRAFDNSVRSSAPWLRWDPAGQDDLLVHDEPWVNIAPVIEPAHLVIVDNETVSRSMTDGQGQPAKALDALVMARRPGSRSSLS